jgi:uncharacterized membrane protein YhaH (DUF805 family)
MTFPQAVQACFRKYIQFSGRSARSEYWYWVLFVVVAGAVCHLIHQYLGYLFSLVTILPGIAVAARRLHDIGRSGWWQLLVFVPVIGWIVLIIWYCAKSQPGSNRFGESSFAGTAAS